MNLNRNKIIRYIIDHNGNFLKVPVRGIVAQEDKVSKIQVITPIKGSLAVEFTIFDSINTKMTQYLPIQKYKAHDILDETNDYFDATQDWYVYEIEIKHKFISKISKHHPGRIGISFTFRYLVENSPNALNYIGTFGRNRIPQTANDGDFIICEYWNFEWRDQYLTKGDILYWFNEQWNLDAVFKPLLNTQTITLAIDPSVYAYIPDDEIDKSEFDNVWLSISDLQEQVLDFSDGGTRIHITDERIYDDKLNVLDITNIIISDKITAGDIVVSRNQYSNGFFGTVKYISGPEIVVEFQFALTGVSDRSNLTFETEEDLMDWLDGDYIRDDELTPDKLFIGQIIFLKERDVPDYWVWKLPVNNINDLEIQESDQTFDRTSVGEDEPETKRNNIWIDTSEEIDNYGMNTFNHDGEESERLNFEVDNGPDEPIETDGEHQVDNGLDEPIETDGEHQVDNGLDEPIETNNYQDENFDE